MFSYIVGTIEYKKDNLLILENNGIGYEISISSNTLANLPSLNEEIKIYTFMHFKEDGVSIYGFESIEEKDLFMKLISVSGVGPKAAISMLSGIKPTDLIIAIMKEDTRLISNVKGIGKKTAERLVLELKDKVAVLGEIPTTIENVVDTPAVDEAINVLISLGVNKNEALKLARANAKAESSAEEIIALCLRGMNN